jgi:hypothetical protein
MGINGIRRKIINTALASSLLFGCSKPDRVSGPSPPPQPVSENNPALITSSALTSIEENRVYDYQVRANDPEGATLNYSISGPSWLSVGPTGEVTGIAPEISSDQNFPIELRVFDGENTTKQNYNLNVRNLFNVYDVSSTTTGITDTSVSFSQPTTFAQGDVLSSGITSQTPSGLLREITSVSSDRKTVYTRQGVLENLVRDASLSYAANLSPSGVRSFNAQQGVSMSPRSTENLNFNIDLTNVILYDRDGNLSTTNDQIIANGNISFSAGFDFNLDIRGFSLNGINFTQTLSDVSDITIGSNLLGFASLSEVKIATYSFTPVVIGFLPIIPAIPVVVVPKIEVYVGLDPSRVNPLSFRIKQDASLTARVSYNGTWSASADFFNSFYFSIFNPTGEWDLEVFAGPRLKLPLFGLIGPSASASTSLRLHSDTQGAWQLFGGLEASVGVSLDAISRRIQGFSKKIIDYERLLTDRGTNPEPLITYVSDLSDNRAVIATINPNGTGRSILTSTSELSYFPIWSPDRREIAYSKWVNDGSVDIFVLGNNGRRLTSTGVNAPGSWSPDGSRMAITSTRDANTDIYTINSTDGSGLSRLTTHSATDAYPVWSSDNWIYFVSRRDGNSEIYKIRPNGTELTRITTNSASDERPNISPDGRFLLFDSDRDGDKEIYSLDLVTGSLIQLTNNSVADYNASFSPDGRNIVFVSERGSRGAQLYTMGINGSNPTNITAENIDNYPRWN